MLVMCLCIQIEICYLPHCSVSYLRNEIIPTFCFIILICGDSYLCERKCKFAILIFFVFFKHHSFVLSFDVFVCELYAFLHFCLTICTLTYFFGVPKDWSLEASGRVCKETEGR